MSRKKQVLIHVNQHVIRRNQKTGERAAPITIRVGRKTQRTNVAIIVDADGGQVAKIVYSPDKPLSCGARVWIETGLEVVAIEDTSSKYSQSAENHLHD
jgi:hypothetical protein